MGKAFLLNLMDTRTGKTILSSDLYRSFSYAKLEDISLTVSEGFRLPFNAKEDTVRFPFGENFKPIEFHVQKNGFAKVDRIAFEKKVSIQKYPIPTDFEDEALGFYSAPIRESVVTEYLPSKTDDNFTYYLFIVDMHFLNEVSDTDRGFSKDFEIILSTLSDECTFVADTCDKYILARIQGDPVDLVLDSKGVICRSPFPKM